MQRDERPTVAVIAAARAGEPKALDTLIAECLPLVYNIVGRALNGHADVDDVVQETMLRVVRSLEGLRTETSFRSWLVAIAMQQVRERWRARQAQPLFELTEATDTADPGADFVDLTILRLGLSGQRVEVTEATRWLDPEDRYVLSLWWLEAAGELTRAELVAGCGIPPQHAAVRVQRMKARLDAARAVVRALASVPRCGALQELIRSWNGRPSSLWRKRIARHTRECPHCTRQWEGMMPAAGLLTGLSLVPLPAGYVIAGLLTAGSGTRTMVKGVRKGTVKSVMASKAAAAVTAGITAAGCIAAIAYAVQPNSHTAREATAQDKPAAASTPLTPTRSPSSTSPSPADTPEGTKAHEQVDGSTTAEAATKPAPRHDKAKVGPDYGQTVDTADGVPDPNAKPLALPRRPESASITGDGKWEPDFKGSMGGKYLMVFQGDYLTITGKGYFSVRYEIGWFNRVGLMQMPTWTGLKGKLFHVASGGGHRMTDPHPGEPATHTWMGNPQAGYITLPAGAQQMWQNEYYYIDGTVTLHENETGPADYNISVTPFTWAEVSKEINTAPLAGTDTIRYGLVRDTGTDSAPVPQYLTRATPADPMTVPQHTRVRTDS
ncbi:RNA polymerase sigma factor [Streptomyces sp. NPDC002920]